MMRVVRRLFRMIWASPNPPRGRDGERGYLLVFSILIMAFGSLVVIGLLGYANVSIRVTDTALGNAEKYFAADAGVMAVMADLVQGVDVLSPGYTKPSVVLNNKTVTLSLSAASPGAGTPAQYRYFDPRASGSLNPLVAGAHYTFQIDNVVAQSNFRVNWSFMSEDKPWKITLYQGAGTGGAVVATDNLTLGPGYLSVDGSLIAGGTYTVDFHNTSDSSTTSASFNASGGAGYTWIYTRAKKDYRITAAAGSTTIAAYVRQEPGPTASPNAKPWVTILSWQAPAATAP